MPKKKIPTYYQIHPPEFATADDLKLEGRQPAEDQKVAALFKVKTSDCERLTGLYRRADAVPLQEKKPA